MELTLFDQLIDRAAVIQLPVVPLIDPSSPWISGHYCDEFAEATARSWWSARRSERRSHWPVSAAPSSGGALARLAAQEGGHPFIAASMTEDYEMGLRVGALGLKTMFVRSPPSRAAGVVSSRGHFPASLEPPSARKPADRRHRLRRMGPARLARRAWRALDADARPARPAGRPADAGRLRQPCSSTDPRNARACGAPIRAALVAGAQDLADGQRSPPWLARNDSGPASSQRPTGWKQGLLSVFPAWVVGNLISILAVWRALNASIRRAAGPLGQYLHIFPAEEKCRMSASIRFLGLAAWPGAGVRAASLGLIPARWFAPVARAVTTARPPSIAAPGGQALAGGRNRPVHRAGLSAFCALPDAGGLSAIPRTYPHRAAPGRRSFLLSIKPASFAGRQGRAERAVRLGRDRPHPGALFDGWGPPSRVEGEVGGSDHRAGSSRGCRVCRPGLQGLAGAPLAKRFDCLQLSTAPGALLRGSWGRARWPAERLAAARLARALTYHFSLSLAASLRSSPRSAASAMCGSSRRCPLEASTMPVALNSERRQALSAGAGETPSLRLAEGGLYQTPRSSASPTSTYTRKAASSACGTHPFLRRRRQLHKAHMEAVSAGVGVWGGFNWTTVPRRCRSMSRPAMMSAAYPAFHGDYRQRLAGRGDAVSPARP